MFFATALLYPCVLAALCLGAGLLIDRLSGAFLPGALLLTVGAAALVALSQLSTYVSGLAPATPYLMAAAALIGFATSRARLMRIAHAAPAHAWPIVAAVAAYLLALAPVLAAGRTSFSSYMALADSAVHMLGADYLMRHGQHYAHLDLRNSYGRFVENYFSTSYPSGADTLFGGSAFLLGLPLIWAFQPFNAYMLASAAGPAWLLARRLGLDGALAALAALTAVLPALVYAYELFGSVKEIASLSMILTLGCLVVAHRDWLLGPARRAIPFALVLAAGVSSLGVAFGAWGLAAAAVLAVVLAHALIKRAGKARAAVLLVGVAALALLVAAWPTWHELSKSLQVAQEIASTSNPGNLRSPLSAEQVLGVWIGGSYKLPPTGAALSATDVLMALTGLAALGGAVNLLARRRGYALAAWIALMLLAWLAVSHSVTTWASAKTLMLTSPVVVLLAWGGVAALKALRVRALAVGASLALSLALAGGVLASDTLQYRASDMAPTARYQELASLDARFAGQGPALFTDFDEYSMYELRDLDVGGPNFVYGPTALHATAGHGDPVSLSRVQPTALAAYPLIVTRRDPSAERPPAAYRLVWQGSYYEVWRRRPHPAPVLRQEALAGGPRVQCKAIGRMAQAASAGRQLVASEAPELIRIPLGRRAKHRSWGREPDGLVMSRPGLLTTRVRLARAGSWKLWVQGRIMPTVSVAIDGRTVESIAGELDGNSLVPNTIPPVTVALSGGFHRVKVTRPGFNWMPGDEGSAVLHAIFLTPSGEPEGGVLRRVSAARWRTLCGGVYQWLELVS
jgi:hypothetical protein